MYTRYINNSTSGFGGYSGDDAHFSYAFDREGFRYTASAPDNVCRAVPDSPTSVDPVPGLDTDDEIAVMARDAGPEAPGDAPLPAGIEAAHTIQLIDPFQLSAPMSYIYVMKAATNGPKPAFNAGNGYVRYQRDANADFFAKWSASYGNARRGPYCDPDGTKVIGNDRRRPNDFATVTTPRYRFRYDGRWVMGGMGISVKDDWTYGPSLVDRWKGRAYAQDPTSEVPCCGFEEEEGNWGESSTLLGEKVGPVRVIRETWGADSGTNVVRRETFYRDELIQTAFLRVHPLPPLGGVYSMWDFNAARVNRFYNPSLPDGVVLDGKNDEELLGSFDDPCNPRYDIPGRYSQIDQGYRDLLQALPYCGNVPYHFSLDEPDPTTSQVGLPWTAVAGPFGTIVDRYQLDVKQVTVGGTPQSLLVLPYYRDDSCFDDGTGNDPGRRVKPGSGGEPEKTAAGVPRKCWAPADGVPDGSDRFYQGSIGSHGINVVMVAESDNARTTLPITEINSTQRLVMLPGDQGNVGEKYGRGLEKPLIAIVQ